MSGNPGTQILLTRAPAQADAYAATLTATFGDRLRLIRSPLLRITDVPGLVDLDGIHTLLFTSVNGVEAFAARTARRDLPALCVGEKSAEAALVAGLSARAADGTAEGLLRLALGEGLGKTGDFLYLRGRHTARDLAEKLVAGGCPAREQVVYDQQAVPLSDDARDALAGGPVLVPLFSPRTARLFAAGAAGIDLDRATALCISDNVAVAIAKAGFGRVIVANDPTAESLTREIAAII
jgi:uroporphyrinogen-III synthase